MAVRSSSQGVLADENREKREEILELLKKAYWLEVEVHRRLFEGFLREYEAEGLA